MKISFITLLEDEAWGGSELLWFKLLKALKSNNLISLSCTVRMLNNPRIKKLKESDTNIKRRKNSNSFWFRILNKTYQYIPLFLLKKIYSISNDTNLIIISLPSSHSLRHHKILSYILDKIKTPFILICQWNSDFGNIYEKPDRSTRIFNKANKLFFVSESNLNCAKRQLLSKLENAQVILNPLNTDSLDYIPFPYNKVIQLACVARLDCNFKGQDLLIEALSKLKHFEWQLNIYGQGKHESYLINLVKLYDLETRVFFKGFCSVNDIWKLNEILILTSVSEGTPLALVEAMTLGRPAIVTNIAGMPEWITHHINGFIIPSLNIKDISNTIELALKNHQKWEAMGLKARNSAMKRSEKHLNYYQLAKAINLNEKI